MVVALPCFHLIRKAYPSARITILTNHPVADKAAPAMAILEIPAYATIPPGIRWAPGVSPNWPRSAAPSGSCARTCWSTWPIPAACSKACAITSFSGHVVSMILLALPCGGATCVCNPPAPASSRPKPNGWPLALPTRSHRHRPGRPALVGLGGSTAAERNEAAALVPATGKPPGQRRDQGPGQGLGRGELGNAPALPVKKTSGRHPGPARRARRARPQRAPRPPLDGRLYQFVRQNFRALRPPSSNIAACSSVTIPAPCTWPAPSALRPSACSRGSTARPAFPGHSSWNFIRTAYPPLPKGG